MCGIAAIVCARGGARASSVAAMCEIVRHRGPDGEGHALFPTDGGMPRLWPSADAAKAERDGGRVALGHRRLAIVDLTEAAGQPMSHGEDGRYWITYNGEIYNHRELRAELEGLGARFRTDCDTEVVLAAYVAWGSDCLARFNGMFAFVLYDRTTDRVLVARDRYGVKPLYWWRAPDGSLAMASEIKQFTVLDGWRARLNGQRAYDYLNWGLTDHTDETMFAGVRQLPPGHFLEATVAELGNEFAPRPWYRLPRHGTPVSVDEAATRFHELLVDAVRVRLRADVEVGTALSGGLDSSSIVCVADSLRRDSGATGSLHAFSARAVDPTLDEGPFIASVLAATNTVQHTVYPDADGLLAELDDVVWHHDEPFGSTSIYAEWRVFRLAREAGIKVTLDGNGGDEILVGYVSSIGTVLGDLLRRGRLLALVREVAAQRRLHRRSYRFLAAAVADAVLPGAARDVLRRIAGHTVRRPNWLDLDRLDAVPEDPFAKALRRHGRDVNGLSLAHLTATSLPMQLKWADRDSMAHSVESRPPFLDYRLVDFTLPLPAGYKFRDGTTKRLLRDAMRGVLPKMIAERRDKMGFVTPEEHWIRRDRPEAFRRALEDAVEAAGGILNEQALELGHAVIDGHRPFHARLWRMICFGRWLRRFDVAVDATPRRTAYFSAGHTVDV